MGAEDPYRWAQDLSAERLPREQVLQQMIGGGVEAGLATEIVDSIERNRPRPRPLRMLFGLVLGVGGVVFLALGFIPLAAVLVVGGVLSVWDGFRGKR